MCLALFFVDMKKDMSIECSECWFDVVGCPHGVMQQVTAATGAVSLSASNTAPSFMLCLPLSSLHSPSFSRYSYHQTVMYLFVVSGILSNHLPSAGILIIKL